jgi:predicted ATPase
MRMKRSFWLKLFGLASVVGVAATGVVIARAERRRRAYTPQEIHSVLRTRYTEATEAASAAEQAK